MRARCAGGRSNVVMAFVSNILSQQFGLAVRSFAATLEPEGFEVLVGQTSYSYAKEVAMIQVAARHPPRSSDVHRRDRARGAFVPRCSNSAFP